jgi:hypothetical protein
MFDQRPDERGAGFGSLTNRLLFMILPETGRLEITLGEVGDLPALPYDVVDRAIQAASMVDMPRFTLTLDRGPLQGNGGVAELLALQQRLGEAMKKARLDGAWRHPMPHVTLLGDVPNPGGQLVVRDFALVQWPLGRTRCFPLARWELGGGAAT